jgi:hypothetical protein
MFRPHTGRTECILSRSVSLRKELTQKQSIKISRRNNAKFLSLGFHSGADGPEELPGIAGCKRPMDRRNALISYRRMNCPTQTAKATPTPPSTNTKSGMMEAFPSASPRPKANDAVAQ